MICERGSLPNTDCENCKFAYSRYCRTGSNLRRCDLCRNSKKYGNGDYDCLCILEPTEEEVETGKCKYYEEYDDANS